MFAPMVQLIQCLKIWPTPFNSKIPVKHNRLFAILETGDFGLGGIQPTPIFLFFL